MKKTKRTKEQKMKAMQRRQLQNERGEYSFSSSSPTHETASKVSSSTNRQVARRTAQDLFPYDLRLIYRDLMKTVGLTVGIVVALFVIAHFI